MTRWRARTNSWSRTACRWCATGAFETAFRRLSPPEGDGYLVDLKADLLDHLNTRVVAPLLPLDQAPKPAATLNPVLDIAGEQVVMTTQFMAAVPSQILKSPVARIDAHRTEITAAIDLLFQGF